MTDVPKRQRITADEINCLIYAYLLDSGFEHSAWALRGEAHLDNSPNAHIPIPRGEIVTLFRKALLYMEAERNFKLSQEKGKGTDNGQDTEPMTLLGRFRAPNDRPLSEEPKIPPRPPILPDPANIEAVRKEGSTSQNGVIDKLVSETGEESRPKKRSRTIDDSAPSPDERSRSTSAQPPVASGSSNPNSSMESIKARLSLHSGVGRLLPLDGEPDGVSLMKGHAGEVFTCAWNPANPSLVASGGKGGSITIWKVGQPDARDSMYGPRPLFSKSSMLPAVPVLKPKESHDMTSISWNKAGTYLAVGHQDATIRIWTPEGKLLATLFGHDAPVFDVAWSPSGDRLVSAGLDSLACVWDLSSPQQARILQTLRGHRSDGCCLDVEWIEQEYFATCGTDCLVIIYKLGQDTPLVVLDAHKDEVNQVRLSPSGHHLASCSDDQTAVVWNIMEQGYKRGNRPTYITLSGVHKKAVSMIQWSPVPSEDGGYNLIAMFSREDREATLWDIRTKQCIRKFYEFHTGTKLPKDIFTHSFDPTGRFYCLGGIRYMVIYSVETGKPIWSWPFVKAYIADIQWGKLNDGRYIVAAKEDATVALLDVAKLGVPALS
ncbi:WD40-repeat-containing domain protein [Cantharellus anzutake]|uniref:WD40-repeat-containing domain protein n=1 Tax=Cantharellus anzutake TaxID=1750568 RepID=UPI001908CC68|nr:WD40-repeat-containing domain protein [Cantharellus anzutake]KAF8338168.1 WD40-repeat-containing domain protein [Cantharellus anzutake]